MTNDDAPAIPRRITVRYGDEDVEYVRVTTPTGTILVAVVLVGAGYVLGLAVALLPVAWPLG